MGCAGCFDRNFTVFYRGPQSGFSLTTRPYMLFCGRGCDRSFKGSGLGFCGLEPQGFGLNSIRSKFMALMPSGCG